MRSRALVATVVSSLLVLTGVASATASVTDDPVRPCAQPDGRVTALALSGTTLFVGGSFTHVRDRSGTSQVRTRLAAVDTTTCDLLPWTATADNDVYALSAVGSTLYVGGAFKNVDGQARARIAAVSTGTGSLLPFAPKLDQAVHALLASATTLYVGGAFNKVDTQARSKLAAFTLASNTLNTTWKPKASGLVSAFALAADGSELYVGGAFTSLNGLSSLPYLGAVDPVNGATDTAFVPGATFPMLNLQADSRGLYAGAGGAGGHLVIWNLDGSLQQPVYQTDGGVQTVSIDGDSLYAGGHFVNDCVGNTGSGHPFLCDVNLQRRKLFEVSLSTGALTSWAPALDSPRGVFTSVVDPSTHALWVGGDFTHVGVQAVAHLAAFPAA